MGVEFPFPGSLTSTFLGHTPSHLPPSQSDSIFQNAKLKLIKFQTGQSLNWSVLKVVKLQSGTFKVLKDFLRVLVSSQEKSG